MHDGDRGGAPSEGNSTIVQLILSAGLIALSVVIVLVFQLHPYVGRSRPGVSYDSFYYVWRSRSIAAEGLAPLRTLPPVVRPHLDRPGFPIVASLMSSFGVAAYPFMILVRAVAAIVVGSAAGAIGIVLLRHPPWSIAIFLLALGTSAAVTGTAIGSLENLLADVPLMAAAAAVPLALHGKASIAGVTALVASAGLVHWVFACLFAALAVATVAATRLGPFEVPDHEAGRGRRSLSLAVSVLVAIGIIAVMLPAPPEVLPSFTTAAGSLGNLHRLGLYRTSVLVPLAAAAAIVVFRRAAPEGRSAVVLHALWAASIPVALAVTWIFPGELKLFRIAAFALGVPVLIAAGLVALVQRGGSRWGPIGIGIATLVVGATLWLTAAPQTGPLNDRAGAKLAARFEQGRAAAAYLSMTTVERPVVFVVDRRPWMFDRVFRAAMPPTLIDRTHVYVGDADDLLSARPLSDPLRPARSRLSQTWWDVAWPHPEVVVNDDPILIGVAAIESEVDRADASIGAGLSVIRGPAPPSDLRPPGPIRLTWGRSILMTLQMLGIFGSVGYAWARALTGVRGAGAIALAPAFGVGVLCIAGTLAARLGVVPSGWTARAVVFACFAAGLALAFAGRSWHRSMST